MMHCEVIDMKAKGKQQYSLLQNLGYLLKRCWRVSKGFLVSLLTMALLQLGTNLIELYIAPIILQKVEQSVPLPEMLVTILLFTLAMLVSTAGWNYLKDTRCILLDPFYQDFFREGIMKSATTSYPNMLDTEFLRKQEQFRYALDGNEEETVPVAILTESGNLLTAVVGFGLYLMVLTGLNPLLLAVVIVTTALSFFVTKHINKWELDTRDEAMKYRYKMV